MGGGGGGGMGWVAWWFAWKEIDWKRIPHKNKLQKSWSTFFFFVVRLPFTLSCHCVNQFVIAKLHNFFFLQNICSYVVCANWSEPARSMINRYQSVAGPIGHPVPATVSE